MPKRYEDRGASGLPVWRYFCGRCGSPIFSHLDAAPPLDFLKAGTLDDPSWVQPQAVLWCQSTQPWVTDPAELPRFEQNPPL